MKIYILYTTSRPAVYKDRAMAVAKAWSQTKGRGDVEIVVERIRPKQPKIITDKDGDRTIDWDWFTDTYSKKEYDGVILHFTPYYRKKWGIKQSINGYRNEKQREWPQFWICCDSDQIAKGYKNLGEFERLMFHEHGHFDEDQDDAVGNVLTQDSVHKVDYELKEIHMYHLLVDYRGKAIKEAVNKVVTNVIKWAKKNI